MTRYAVVLVALLLVLPAKACYDNHQQELGRRDAELVLLRPKVDTLEARVRSLSDSLKVKVRIAYRTKTVWDTLVVPLIPDLQRPNAAPVPAATVARIVLVGREAMFACHDALSTCQTLIPVKDSIIEYKDREIDILRSRVPNRWDGLREWGVRVGLFWLGTQLR